MLRDKLWFFTAARFEKNSTNVTAPYTGFNYTKDVDDKRGEGKLTYAINPRNTAKVSYLRKSLATDNDSFSTIMDEASLYDSNVAESLFAGNYQAVLTNNLFIEAQYSQRVMDTTGVGSSYMDLLKGTPIWDRSRGQARFSAPTYCAVCPNARQPPEQLGRVRQAQLLPLDEEPGLPQHRRRLRHLQGDAQEQPELVGQQLPRAGDDRDHRRPEHLPGVQDRHEHLRRMAAGLRGDEGERPAHVLRVLQRRLARQHAAHAQPRRALRQEQHPGPGRRTGRRRLHVEPPARRDVRPRRRRASGSPTSATRTTSGCS